MYIFRFSTDGRVCLLLSVLTSLVFTLATQSNYLWYWYWILSGSACAVLPSKMRYTHNQLVIPSSEVTQATIYTAFVRDIRRSYV